MAENDIAAAMSTMAELYKGLVNNAKLDSHQIRSWAAVLGRLGKDGANLLLEHAQKLADFVETKSAHEADSLLPAKVPRAARPACKDAEAEGAERGEPAVEIQSDDSQSEHSEQMATDNEPSSDDNSRDQPPEKNKATRKRVQQDEDEDEDEEEETRDNKNWAPQNLINNPGKTRFQTYTTTVDGRVFPATLKPVPPPSPKTNDSWKEAIGDWDGAAIMKPWCTDDGGFAAKFGIHCNQLDHLAGECHLADNSGTVLIEGGHISAREPVKRVMQAARAGAYGADFLKIVKANMPKTYNHAGEAAETYYETVKGDPDFNKAKGWNILGKDMTHWMTSFRKNKNGFPARYKWPPRVMCLWIWLVVFHDKVAWRKANSNKPKKQKTRE